MGNNPDADGTPYARQGLDWQRLELTALQQGATSDAAKSQFYRNAALNFAFDQPAAYARLLYAKFRLFWHAFEIPVSTDLHYHADHSLLYRVLWPGYGFFVPLALAAICWNRLPDPGEKLLYGFILAYLATGLLFSVCARYRLPALPFLLVFAARGSVLLIEFLKTRDYLRLGAFLGLAGLAGALVHTGVDTQKVDRLRSTWLVGHVHMRQRDHAAAAEIYRNGLTQLPNDSDLYNSLGVAYRFQQQTAAAEEAFHRSLELAPDHSRPRLNLAQLYRDQNRLELALSSLEKVQRHDLRPAIQYETLYEMGQVYMRQARHFRAYQTLKKALEFKQTAPAHYTLAAAASHINLGEAQLQALERAVALDPTFAPAHRNLGVLYFKRGDLAAAERALLQAVQYAPNTPLGYHHLGALYQRMGQMQKRNRPLPRLNVCVAQHRPLPNQLFSATIPPPRPPSPTQQPHPPTSSGTAYASIPNGPTNSSNLLSKSTRFSSSKSPNVCTNK